MSARYDLPDDHWIETQAPDEVPEKYLRKLRTAAFDLSPQTLGLVEGAGAQADLDAIQAELVGALNAADIEVLFHLNDLAATALIVAWSFDDDGKHPSPDQITDLPRKHYEAIQAAVAKDAAALINGPDFDPTPELSSPTAPLSD